MIIIDKLTNAEYRFEIYINYGHFSIDKIKQATGCEKLINLGYFAMDDYKKAKNNAQVDASTECDLVVAGRPIKPLRFKEFGAVINEAGELSFGTADGAYSYCIGLPPQYYNGQKYCCNAPVEANGATHIGFMADGSILWALALKDKPETNATVNAELIKRGCVSILRYDGSWSSQGIMCGMTYKPSQERIVQSLLLAYRRDATKPINEPAVNLKLGSRGDAVKVLQTSLNKLGYNCGESDGVFGAMTKATVIAFQRAHSLTADGVAGKLTQAAINAQLGTVPKPSTVTPISTESAELKAKAAKVLELIEASVGDLYVYGAQGQTDIATTVNWSARCFPTYTTAARAARMKAYAAAHPVKANGQPIKCEDCSGLFWAAENQVELPFGKFDVDDSTAESLYSLYCDPVKKSELRPLDFVFAGNPINHVAVVGYDGKIYEAAGSDIGVVCNDSVDDRTMTSIFGGTCTKAAWTKFGRLKILRDINLQ